MTITSRQIVIFLLGAVGGLYLGTSNLLPNNNSGLISSSMPIIAAVVCGLLAVMIFGGKVKQQPRKGTYAKRFFSKLGVIAVVVIIGSVGCFLMPAAAPFTIVSGLLIITSTFRRINRNIY